MTFDPSAGFFPEDLDGCKNLREIETFLMAGVTRVSNCINASGQYKTGPDMFKEMFFKQWYAGTGPANSNIIIYYTVVIWHGKPLDYLCTELAGKGSDVGGLGGGHGPALQRRTASPSPLSADGGSLDPPGSKNKDVKVMASSMAAIAADNTKATLSRLRVDNINVGNAMITQAQNISQLLQNGSLDALYNSDEDEEKSVAKKRLQKKARLLLSDVDHDFGGGGGLPPLHPHH